MSMKPMHGTVALVGVCSLCVAMLQGFGAQGPGTSPELIVHNAKVTTQDTSRPHAEAIAVRDGKITAVGATKRC